MNEISYQESLALDCPVYVDVRSPQEFESDHVTGSLNVPLFDNDERKEVGTIYRLAGRYDAIIRGTEIVGEKLKDIVRRLYPFNDRKIIVMCARGGMRSGSLVSLLESLGMTVYKLAGGYKGYRRHVMEQLEAVTLEAPLFVLQGLTGSGKTEIIRKTPNAFDLEEMAGHRSSVFGGIDQKQKTQKRFESLILDRIHALAHSQYTLIEAESRKIGNLHLPEPLYRLMKESPVIYLDTPLERRVEIIYNEYRAHCNDENIPAIVRGLSSKLGQKNTDNLLHLYSIGSINEFIREMLVKYYDPLYQYSLGNNNYAAVIRNLNTDDSVEKVRVNIENYMKKNI
jgi:tRNA 2-selenouridine synthase